MFNVKNHCSFHLLRLKNWGLYSELLNQFVSNICDQKKKQQFLPFLQIDYSQYIFNGLIDFFDKSFNIASKSFQNPRSVGKKAVSMFTSRLETTGFINFRFSLTVFSFHWFFFFSADSQLIPCSSIRISQLTHWSVSQFRAVARSENPGGT